MTQERLISETVNSPKDRGDNRHRIGIVMLLLMMMHP